MTSQTAYSKCLGGSPAAVQIARLCTLTLAAILILCGAAAGQAQAKPDAAKPAKAAAAHKPATPGDKVVAGYTVHQSIELGGHVASTSGSTAMWDTMVNQGSGARMLNQSLEMRSNNPSKTPFFDTLSTFSTGFGGDSSNVARLKVSKGKIYEFSGSFRRDRNFFDYNQFVNSLLTNYTSALATTSTPYNSGSITTGPVLVAEPNTLHFYNTVRRNSDMNVVFMPVAPVSYRVGYNHGTHEGPSLITEHYSGVAGDQQLFQWFRNAQDTFTAGVDAHIAKRTTLSYDQFVVLYKGDSNLRMPTAGTPNMANEYFQVNGSSGLVASPGVDVYNLAYITTVNGSVTPNTTSTSYNCGNAAVTGGGSTVPSTVPSPNAMVNSSGYLSQYCKATTSLTQTQPTRAQFPTEQLRFSSRYWDRLSFNGRLLYNGGKSDINHFNLSWAGFGDTKPSYSSSAKTWNNATIAFTRTGNGTQGQYATNKRAALNGDFGAVAEISKRLSVSDVYSYQAFRTEGYYSALQTTYAIPTNDGLLSGGAVPSLLSTTSSPGVVTTMATSTAWNWLNQKIASNTVVGSFIVSPQIKVSGGWRLKMRTIDFDSLTAYYPSTNMTWTENGALAGAVIEPTRTIRVNVNYEMANAKKSGTTVANTFTRTAPNKQNHLRARAMLKPSKWLNLAVASNDYWAENDDPMVNHKEHNRDISFAATLNPTDNLSFDFNYAHDDVYSITDLCYAWVPDANFPNYPTGAANSGTCTAANSPNGGAATLYLDHGVFDAPSNYFSGAFYYAPTKLFHVNGGVRLNSLNGTAEALNPFQLPGSLKSRTLMPFADAEVKLDSQWAWHGNWSYNGYGEQGTANLVTAGYLSNGLPSRNMHGNVVTLGVKYAF